LAEQLKIKNTRPGIFRALLIYYPTDFIVSDQGQLIPAQVSANRGDPLALHAVPKHGLSPALPGRLKKDRPDSQARYGAPP